KRIQGTLLLIKTVLFTDILESEDVKIVISHRNCETVFSEGSLKLKPEEKNAIEISLAYMKDQFKGFEIEVVDKKFAAHFAQMAKKEKQLMEKRWAEEKKKAAEKALDF
ncbi:MAG: hypothetical protein J6Q81_03555, partial [Lentisphaeria bacterium]|nr:hypothetical protein [Lentisphaeria bacterium]